jgi:hypothetical protein
MSTTWQYRPSKRPKVSQVKHWDLVFDDYTDRHWRGDAYNGGVEVFRGYPFPDFYKVVFIPAKSSEFSKKISKLFYGESAHHDVTRFVSDLGFQSIYTSNLY